MTGEVVVAIAVLSGFISACATLLGVWLIDRIEDAIWRKNRMQRRLKRK